MTWAIVTGIITLMGACISICKIVANNTKAMTEIKCSFEELNRSLTAEKETVNDIQKAVNNHEIRIVKLEK